MKTSKYKTLCEPPPEEGSNAPSNIVDQITQKVVEKLTKGQSFKPGGDSLVDRVNAWKFKPEPSRPETKFTCDNRPILKVENPWATRPENSLQVGDTIVPRQPLEQPWMEGHEWRNSVTRMDGYFQRVPKAIYEDRADTSEAVGPKVPVNKEDRHRISY